MIDAANTNATLVINSGSSSIKFALYSVDENQQSPLIRGKIAGIGRAPDFTARDANNQLLAEHSLQTIAPDAGHDTLTEQLLNWCESQLPDIRVAAAGHRVVHGGQQFHGPVQIDEMVLQALTELTPLAPLHQPHNLAAVRAIAKRLPNLPQAACFDTAFHRTQPRIAQLFGLPKELSDAGITRYGFHGLSYDYMSQALPAIAPDIADGRIIVAHLGNGASMCAMHERRSVATTMGFTALHGLLMGRRCGTLDAGIVLHLIEQLGMAPDRVQQLLYRESGLLGVSGISNSMRDLTSSTSPQASEAVELFCYRAVSEIGSLTAALQGLDALVFTAGIGENSAVVREKICAKLGWLGIELDGAANSQGELTISVPGSKVRVLVVPTNEELVIARATNQILRNNSGQ